MEKKKKKWRGRGGKKRGTKEKTNRRRDKKRRETRGNAEKREREREEFPSVAVDEQQPRLEGEGTVEMGEGGRRGWKRGYRGFILIPAGA